MALPLTIDTVNGPGARLLAVDEPAVAVWSVAESHLLAA